MRRIDPTSPRGARGFTLVELMVVVVIVGIMGALAAPSFNRDNRARDCRDLASDIGRELQKSRVEAVSTRLGIRAFVFSDRVELRPFRLGATPGAPPTAPAVTDPLSRAIALSASVRVQGVTAAGVAAPATPALTPSVHADIDFTNQGAGQLVGQPVPTGVTIYVQSTTLPASSADFDYRIDITALTGFVSVRAN